MGRLSLWKFNEASSGTAPTSIVDSDASPKNLSLTYNGAAAWTTITGYGKALSWPSANTSTFATAATSADKFTAFFDGTAKTCSLVTAVQLNAAAANNNYGSVGVGWQNTSADGVLLQCGDKIGTATVDLGISATFSGTGGDWAIIVGGAANFPANGYHVFHSVIDTANATANNRALIYVDGFVVADVSTGTAGAITQNSTLPVITDLECGGLSFDPTQFHLNNFDCGLAAIYSNAFTASDCLRQALRLFAANGNDTDPDAAGANLLAASTNGGTNDVSANNTDHTISFTVTIGASNNRKVVLPIAYFGVTTGVTAITFNGSATGVHLSAQQQSATSGCDIYEILDADLPGAGTYTVSVTVDGATGVACGTPVYVEGVAQSYATNTGLATGTGTSITATLAGSASAGSILIGQLLDVSFGDAPVSGVNQLGLVSQTTSSAIRQKADAKYVTSSGSDSMSWTGLTNTTGKVAVVIEAVVAGAATPAPKTYGPPLGLRVAVEPALFVSRAIKALAAPVAATAPRVVRGLNPTWLREPEDKKFLSRAIKALSPPVPATAPRIVRGLNPAWLREDGPVIPELIRSQPFPALVQDAGTNTPMTISVTQTQTSSIARALGALKSATAVQVLTRLRALTPVDKTATAVQVLVRTLGVVKPVSATQVQVSSLTKGQTFLKTFTATAAQILSRVISIGTLKAATQVQTGVRTIGLVSLKSATSTQVPTKVREVGLPRSATATQVPTAAKGSGFFKTISATALQVATRIIGIGSSKSATQTQVPSTARALGVVKTATQAQVSSTLKSVLIAKTVTAAQVPVRIREIGKPVATVTQTQTASRTRDVGKSASSTQTQVPNLASRALARSLLATATQTLALTRGLARLLSVTETQAPSADVAQSGGGAHSMTLTATVTQTTTLLRAIARQLTGTQVQVPVDVRAVGRTRSTTNTQTPSIAKGAGHLVTASTTAVQVPARALGLGIVRSVQHVQLLARTYLVSKFVSVTQNQAATRAKALARSTSVTATQIPSLVKGQGYFKTLTATAVQAVTRAVGAGVTRSVIQAQTGAAARALGLLRTATQLQMLTRVRNVARLILGLSAQSTDDTHGRPQFMDLSATQAQTPSIDSIVTRATHPPTQPVLPPPTILIGKRGPTMRVRPRRGPR